MKIIKADSGYGDWTKASSLVTSKFIDNLILRYGVFPKGNYDANFKMDLVTKLQFQIKAFVQLYDNLKNQ